MIDLVKKLLAPIAAIIAFLSFAPFAFAQLNISPGGDFANLNFRAANVSKIIEALIALIFIVAVVIALFFLLWGAVKWIMSGGDKAAVESARGMIVAAVVGLVILFLAFLLLNVLLAFFGVDIKNIAITPIKV